MSKDRAKQGKKGDYSMTNMNKLKGKMRERDISYDLGAEIIGKSATSFNNKINGKTKSGFNIEEANKLSEALQLTSEERMEIFFGN